MEYTSIAQNLFSRLRSVSSHLIMGDKDAQTTTDTDKAHFFSFKLKLNGVQCGDITINLSEDELKVYYGKDLLIKLGEHKSDWYDFLKDMRRFAKQNMVKFTVRDITKSDFDEKDFKYLSSTHPENQKDDTVDDVNESKMYGSRKSSYQRIGEEVKIIVRHKRTVDEDVKGSRSRNISKLFLECGGERHELPFKGLMGARAMARHVNEGGGLDDDIASHICETMANLGQLRSFINYSRKNHLVTEDNADIVANVMETYKGMRNGLNKMCSRSGYNKFAESFEPSAEVLEEDGLDELRDRFTVKTVNDSAMEALPLVNRIQTTKVQSRVSEIQDFIDNGTMMLEDDIGCDELAYSVNYKDPTQLVRWAMEDIESRIMNNESVKAFAGRMKKADIIQNEDGRMATQMARKYVEDLGRIRNEDNYRDTVRSMVVGESTDHAVVTEAELFADWANKL